MIVRPRPTAFSLIFIMRGSILPTVLPRVIAVMIVAAAVTWLHHKTPRLLADVTAAPFTLLGLALSIFLGFRNNACYERWWEGRRQWGQLVAEARSLARDFVTLLPEDPALRRRCVRRIVAFAHALRAQLRDTPDEAAREFLPEPEWARVEPSRSRPDIIQLTQAADIAGAYKEGGMPDVFVKILSDRLWAMTTIQTACERLKSAPTPFTYTLLLHRTAWLFCLLLPFGVVGTLGLGTPLLTAILAYAFFGLDALGEELEEPFGTTQNALPLSAMVRAIEIAAGEALGETDLPAALLPEAFLLL
jgi:putative membrane protein